MAARNAERVRDLLDSTSIYWIGLVIALIALAFVVRSLRAWYRDGDDPAVARDEIIRQMEELKRRGDLSDEEFRSIKSQVSGHNDR